MYKEVERRPAVGAEDLSLQNISVGSALFNAQSKCTSSYAVIVRLIFRRSCLSDQMLNSHLLWLPLTDEISPLPVQVPVVKPDPERANPKIGVSALAFSPDSRYLATKNGTFIFFNLIIVYNIGYKPNGIL